jgi:hypothetical protein
MWRSNELTKLGETGFSASFGIHGKDREEVSMNHDNKVCTIIGSDKGGIGKSMVALIMTLVFDKAGVPLSVIEVDNQRKLTSALGSDRVDLSLAAAPELRDVTGNRHAAESFYNGIYMEWLKGISLTDLGANVTTPLMEWFKQCDIGELAAEDGIRFRFVSCASPDEQAIKSAFVALDTAAKALGPSAEYHLVLNDLFGSHGFAPYENNPSYRILMDLEQTSRINVIRIGYCDSLLFEHGKAMGLTPLQAISRCDEVAASAGLDVVSARVHKKKMMNWLRDTQQAMTPLLMIDEDISHEPAAAFGGR